jgi:aconitate hydratase 2/2-methylisocitrate dehydratase
LETVGNKLANTAEIYKYLNFDQMTDYTQSLEALSNGKKVIPIAEAV